MLKLGFNEATCKENSSVEKDLALCEKYGYDYIELRLDMLKDYLKTHTVDDLKAFFAGSHLKPFAFNSIENINFCTPAAWKGSSSCSRSAVKWPRPSAIPISSWCPP